ncbi:MAG: hypothetical protein WBC63_02565, partial [Candidatus Bipolaricaulia bacterium]
QVIYRLNPRCPIHDELRSIIHKTVGLAGVMREALEPFADRIELAYMYTGVTLDEGSVPIATSI